MHERPALMNDDWHRGRLCLPGPRPRVVIDTDASNEIDDQFALAWALLSPEQLDVEAIYAAPFSFAHRRALLPNAPTNAAPFNPPEIANGIRTDASLLILCRPVASKPNSTRTLSTDRAFCVVQPLRII